MTASRVLVAAGSHIPRTGAPSLRPCNTGTGHGHLEPHDRLVLRPRFVLQLGPLLRACRAAGRTRRRHSRRRGVKAGPRTGVTETRGARPHSARDLVACTSGSTTVVSGHLAGVGRRSRVQGRRRDSNDISGFADPEYLVVASAAEPPWWPLTYASRPECRPDTPLRRCGGRGRALPASNASNEPWRAGSRPDRIAIDAGLDLGKTAHQSLLLLQNSARLASLGYRCCCRPRTRRSGVLLDLDLA